MLANLTPDVIATFAAFIAGIVDTIAGGGGSGEAATGAVGATLDGTCNEDGSRRWSDRTINRMMAHLKTFAKWIHRHSPFPLGQPMEKIKMLAIGNRLEIERALTKQERNRILDAADQLLVVGGRSRDRHRHGGAMPPQRRGFRPFRNRAKSQGQLNDPALVFPDSHSETV